MNIDNIIKEDNNFNILKGKNHSIYKFIFIILIIIFIVLKGILINNYLNNNHNYKVCICTVGKNENQYALEFIEHYKKYGVDKIFIYDNNDRNGQRFESVLSDYIRNNFVKIVNVRGKRGVQIDAFNHCNWQNYQKYNWLIFFDFDEFISLKNYTNIKTFLKDKKFDKCKVIYLNERIHTDNNQLYYQNKSLVERFTEINYNRRPIMVKSLIRGRTKHLQIVNNHVIKVGMEGCNGYGKIIKNNVIYAPNPDFDNFFFDHYFSKSTEEYLTKLGKGDVFYSNLKNKINADFISLYFDYNKITLEKINLFENKTGINISVIRDKLKKN